MAIDYATVVGKLRLRCGDISDLPFLDDATYNSVYEENDADLNRAAKQCATYILAQLSFKTHRKLAQLEVWGKESFDSYKEFLLLTINNPAFMSIAPIAYSGYSEDPHKIIQFQQDWNKEFLTGTQSQQMALDAAHSPNQDTLYGPAAYSYPITI